LLAQCQTARSADCVSRARWREWGRLGRRVGGNTLQIPFWLRK
jgi:hypothetical protein